MSVVDSCVRGPVCHDNGIRGYGNPEHKVMLIGISPGREETRTGIPMTGVSGRLIDNILEACSWSRDKVYATNVVCTECNTPTLEQVMECRPRLQQEVRDFKPALTLLLGNPVTELFFPDRKPGTVRGMIDWYAPWDTYVLPTYHPAACLYTPSEMIMRDIIRDFQKIAPFFDEPINPDVTWKVLTGPQELQHVLDTWPRDKRCSFDLETPMKEEDDTSSINDKIVCFSVSDGTNTWWGPGDFLQGVKFPLDLRWGGQNFNFDSISYYQATGVLLPITWDSQYASYCLDERSGRHKLKTNAREYEGAGFYEEYKQPLPKMPRGVKRDSPAGHAIVWNHKLSDLSWAQQYNSKDSAYAARITDRFEPRIREDGMWPIYQMTLQAAHVYRQMQIHGVYLHPERFKELLCEWVPQLDIKASALQKLCASLGGDPDINLGSPLQLQKFLYGTLRLPGGPSTAAEVLEQLEDEHEFIAKLQDLRHLEKAVGTYLVGVHEHLKGQRVHPSPLLHGTVSGRLAYNNPAINTTPKTYNENPYLQRLRSLYTASDDEHILIEMDYKQAEVWMAWIYSQDEQMRLDLLSGDFHRQSAAYINKVPIELVTLEQRSDAKRITFGKFFLIGVDKFTRQANREKRRDAERLGIPFTNGITKADAATFIREWDRRYQGYGQYVNDMFIQARDNGELVSLTGRKRRFPLVLDTNIMPQCCNWPIQSTAHDCLMSSIIEMYPVLESMGAYCLIDVHDAVLIEAKKSNVLEVAKVARDIMVKPRFPGVPSLPVEVKLGYSWAEMEEIELAA